VNLGARLLLTETKSNNLKFHLWIIGVANSQWLRTNAQCYIVTHRCLHSLKLPPNGIKRNAQIEAIVIGVPFINLYQSVESIPGERLRFADLSAAVLPGEVCDISRAVILTGNTILCARIDRKGAGFIGCKEPA